MVSVLEIAFRPLLLLTKHNFFKIVEAENEISASNLNVFTQNHQLLAFKEF